MGLQGVRSSWKQARWGDPVGVLIPLLFQGMIVLLPIGEYYYLSNGNVIVAVVATALLLIPSTVGSLVSALPSGYRTLTCSSVWCVIAMISQMWASWLSIVCSLLTVEVLVLMFFSERLLQSSSIRASSMRLSCKSDVFDESSDMVGMVLWSFEGKTDWTLNNVHCKSGYVYMKDTSSIMHIHSSFGAVHGKLYKSLFQCEPTNIVGTGFAYKDGEFKFNSGVFNASSKYHNEDREASQSEKELILRVVKDSPGTTMTSGGGRTVRQHR